MQISHEYKGKFRVSIYIITGITGLVLVSPIIILNEIQGKRESRKSPQLKLEFIMLLLLATAINSTTSFPLVTVTYPERN